MTRGTPSEGAVRLGRIPETQGQIARRIGVKQPTVSDWVCFKKKPDYANRMLFQRHYEIPHDAWDRLRDASPEAELSLPTGVGCARPA